MCDSNRRCLKCGGTANVEESVYNHRFPKPGKTNVLRARCWAKFCWPEQYWLSVADLTKKFSSHKVLCGRHFESTCFTDSSNKRLSKFSIPGQAEYTSQLLSELREETLNMETLLNNLEDKENFASNMQEQDKAGPAYHEQNLEANDKPVQKQQNRAAPAYRTQNYEVTENDKPVQREVDEAGPSVPINCGILKSLNVSRMKQLTPREQKLAKICRLTLKKVNRLKLAIRKKKKTNQVKKVCEIEHISKMFNLNMKNSFIVLLQSQMKNSLKLKKGRRYNLDQKIMALSLYKKSPACYRLLRRYVTMPCQSTLNKLLNRVPLKSGISEQIFLGLKDMAITKSKNENVCILSFDEMAIRKNLTFNNKLNIIEGYQDHGNHGRSSQIASNALVFMVAGIRKRWKQPVAFYLSGKSVTADRLSVIIKEILNECSKIGLNILATVCDLSQVNIRALNLLGSSTEYPYFSHGGREIVTILDPPHLIKCTRNLFMKYDVHCTIHMENNQTDGRIVEGIAKWSHIKLFHDLDKNNANFVFATALTEQHLNPNTKQKMRVKLAAQVFSHSVAGGMLSKIATNELPSEAHTTAMLLSKFDQLFDSLNADSPDRRGGKMYSTNLTDHSPHRFLFMEMRKFIKSMKYINSSSRPPSQDGWIRTINAVERLWKNMRSSGIKSLSTRRLNQDPLENCFGCIRYYCGSNLNPTVPQFISGIKTAIINNLRHSGSKRNCEDDNISLCNNLKKNLTANNNENIDNTEVETTDSLDPLILELDAIEAVEQASPEGQACAYVCGFIFKRFKNNNCSLCKIIFLSQNSYEPLHMFTNFKEYDTIKNSLLYVSKEMVKCVEICATITNNFLKSQSWENKLKDKVMSALSQVDFSFMLNCKEHFKNNVEAIKMSSFYICVKRYTI